MAPVGEYIAKMRDCQKQFNLPDAILPLFNALFKKQHGGNPNYLTRMMQSSPDNAKLVLDVTGELLAKVVAERLDPAIVSNCMEMIQGCKEILSATNEALVAADHFPFMKLPLELRYRVYKHYISGQRSFREPPPISGLRHPDCGCLQDLNSKRTGIIKPLNIDLCLTCRNIKDEFLTTLFENNVFSFKCCCDLLNHLTNNALRHNIRTFWVHWSGDCSADAFKRIRAVATMRCVTILVSPNTARCKSTREREWDKHFNRRVHHRLTDASGFDELTELAQHVGLDKVKVAYLLKESYDNNRPSCNVKGLRSYLKSKCEASE